MNARKHKSLVGFRRQSGAVLAVSLLMLLVMTLIGISGIGVTSLEEKMAGNTRDRNLAFQAAEAALRAGEDEIYASAVAVDANGQPTGMGLTAFEALFSSGGSSGYYIKDAVPDSLILGDGSSWAVSAKVKTCNLTLNGVSAQPKYVIEKLDPDVTGKKHPFRITAYATGGTASAVVVLQSTYEVETP